MWHAFTVKKISLGWGWGNGGGKATALMPHGGGGGGGGRSLVNGQFPHPAPGGGGQGGVTPIEPIQTLSTGGFDRLDRPLTPNLGGVVTFSHGLMQYEIEIVKLAGV